MGLFSKAPEVDAHLMAVALSTTAPALKGVSKAQAAIRQAVDSDEAIEMIAGALNMTGVITTKRLLIFIGERFDRGILLADVSGVHLERWHGGGAVVGSPQLIFNFNTIDEALRLATKLDQLDISPLWPQFYEDLMNEIGVAKTAENLAHLQDWIFPGFVAGGPAAYFRSTGDDDAKQRFWHAFVDGPDAPGDPTTALDRMIEWLWAWDWRCHGSLRDLVPLTRNVLTEAESPLRRAIQEVGGDTIPPRPAWT